MILTSNSFGQTIEELEYDLSWYQSSEKYGDKIEKAKRLQEIDPFNYRATEYICRYYNDRKIDSVSIYFDNLIAKFPDKTEPYLLRSELLFLELDSRDKDEYNRRKVKYLKQGLEINPKDSLLVFKLAEAYYKDFIFPLEKKRDWGFSFDFKNELFDSTLVVKEKPIKKSTFEHAADSSLYYFYQVWDLREDKRDIIYYPIKQLECFLKQNGKTPIPKNTERNFSQCYFPSSYFTNLTDNWECDFSTDYLFEIKSGKRTAEWLQAQLSDLKEDCLYNNETRQNSIIYRFTWLRSFHHPIAIRIEKVENEIMLYWKVGKGRGGYEPEGLKKSGNKKLSLKQWIEFEGIVKASNFDSLPNEKYIPMTDGATWTLERKKHDSFKAHHTNSPSKEISKACLYLLDLTNIKIKDDDKY
ncbi:hypothetical protein NMK71_06210 [Weeksellaceae bacterium KMM 9713]|uniref:Tetratricopeptide repeat protein n=1 Tax=Profundicola chukchiensis TaxID=2961959 RepID=A0A9X4N0F3_9FLAO|nr:hypothetical protein [Profundicola chukchiensis]MDG4946001.1 hypothetical protein [Profundicola chukchiensis]